LDVSFFAMSPSGAARRPFKIDFLPPLYYTTRRIEKCPRAELHLASGVSAVCA